MVSGEKKPRAKRAVTKPAETLVAYKAFNPDLTCNGFQYEVGKTYELGREPEMCRRGFHACEHPFDVFNYYPFGSRLARVTLAGTIIRQSADSDSKICGAAITVDAELTVPEFVKAAVTWIVKAAKGNVATGDRGHAAATGYSGHAAATGYRGHAAATGYSGHAAATGDRGHAAATGDRGHAAATGYRGHAAATGDRGHAAATGDYGIAASLGPDSTAKAGESGWIVLTYWDTDSWPYKLVRVERFKIGTNGVEAGKTYRLNKSGKPVEVR